jgi:hypothetical protein
MSATAVMSSDSVRDDLVSLSPQVMTDERLVKATKTGHRAAFDELYKRHHDRMFRVTHRITRNREDADTVMSAPPVKGVFSDFSLLSGLLIED